jgi:hypothetical protein
VRDAERRNLSGAARARMTEVQHKINNDRRAPSLFNCASQSMAAAVAILDGLQPHTTHEEKQAREQMQRYLRLAADQQGGSVGPRPRASQASVHASAVRKVGGGQAPPPEPQGGRGGPPHLVDGP